MKEQSSHGPQAYRGHCVRCAGKLLRQLLGALTFSSNSPPPPCHTQAKVSQVCPSTPSTATAPAVPSTREVPPSAMRSHYVLCFIGQSIHPCVWHGRGNALNGKSTQVSSSSLAPILAVDLPSIHLNSLAGKICEIEPGRGQRVAEEVDVRTRRWIHGCDRTSETADSS